MKKLVVLASACLGISLSFGANASDFWEKHNKDFGIKTADHGFCYQDEKGEFKGTNVHKKVTLASVSKMVTTFWAVKELSLDYHYETKFLVKGKKLHIEGSLDPVFSDRKLFFIVSQLQNLGLTDLEEITFDKNLRVFTKAEDYAGTVVEVTPARTAANLFDFWHTPDWNKLKDAYKAFIAETPKSIRAKLNLIEDLNDLKVKVGKVSFVETAPFDATDAEVTTYIHRSPEIEKYLKFLNILSNNYIADQVFDRLGGEVEFEKFFATWMDENLPDYNNTRVGFKDGEPSLKMFTGSGLDSTRDGKRVDNYSSCAVIVKMMMDMDKTITEIDRKIQNTVAVPGVDLGTFRARLNSPRIARTLVAKTGTLMHTSSLTGIISTVKGKIPFGIFHQLTGAKGNAKIVQDRVVDELITLFGGAKKFDYTPEFFFPAYEEIK